jgi:hypothetical protein
MDPRSVVPALQAVLNGDPKAGEFVNKAEQSLSGQAALVDIVCSPLLYEAPVRLLVAIRLQNLCKVLKKSDATKSRHPILSERDRLLRAYEAEADRRIADQLRLSLTSVARLTWPKQWPALFDGLCARIMQLAHELGAALVSAASASSPPPPPPQLRGVSRLGALCRAVHADLRAKKRLPADVARLANAVQAGLLPCYGSVLIRVLCPLLQAPLAGVSGAMLEALLEATGAMVKGVAGIQAALPAACVAPQPLDPASPSLSAVLLALLPVLRDATAGPILSHATLQVLRPGHPTLPAAVSVAPLPEGLARLLADRCALRVARLLREAAHSHLLALAAADATAEGRARSVLEHILGAVAALTERQWQLAQWAWQQGTAGQPGGVWADPAADFDATLPCLGRTLAQLLALLTQVSDAGTLAHNALSQVPPASALQRLQQAAVDRCWEPVAPLLEALRRLEADGAQQNDGLQHGEWADQVTFPVLHQRSQALCRLHATLRRLFGGSQGDDGLRQWLAWLTMVGLPMAFSIPLDALGLVSFSQDSEAWIKDFDALGPYETASGATGNLLLSLVADEAYAVPVCQQILAHVHRVESEVRLQANISASALLSLHCAWHALGLIAADAVARGVLTSEATRIWLESSLLPCLSALGLGSATPAPGSNVDASEEAVGFALRTGIWLLGCCMSILSVDMQRTILRTILLVPSLGHTHRSGDAAVRVAAAALVAQFIESMPSGDPLFVGETSGECMRATSLFCYGSLSIVQDPDNQLRCLAPLSSFIGRCPPRHVVAFADGILQPLPELWAKGHVTVKRHVIATVIVVIASIDKVIASTESSQDLPENFVERATTLLVHALSVVHAACAEAQTDLTAAHIVEDAVVLFTRIMAIIEGDARLSLADATLLDACQGCAAFFPVLLADESLHPCLLRAVLTTAIAAHQVPGASVFAPSHPLAPAFRAVMFRCLTSSQQRLQCMTFTALELLLQRATEPALQFSIISWSCAQESNVSLLSILVSGVAGEIARTPGLDGPVEGSDKQSFSSEAATLIAACTAGIEGDASPKQDVRAPPNMGTTSSMAGILGRLLLWNHAAVEQSISHIWEARFNSCRVSALSMLGSLLDASGLSGRQRFQLHAAFEAFAKDTLTTNNSLAKAFLQQSLLLTSHLALAIGLRRYAAVDALRELLAAAKRSTAEHGSANMQLLQADWLLHSYSVLLTASCTCFMAALHYYQQALVTNKTVANTLGLGSVCFGDPSFCDELLSSVVEVVNVSTAVEELRSVHTGPQNQAVMRSGSAQDHSMSQLRTDLYGIVTHLLPATANDDSVCQSAEDVNAEAAFVDFFADICGWNYDEGAEGTQAGGVGPSDGDAQDDDDEGDAGCVFLGGLQGSAAAGRGELAQLRRDLCLLARRGLYDGRAGGATGTSTGKAVSGGSIRASLLACTRALVSAVQSAFAEDTAAGQQFLNAAVPAHVRLQLEAPL